MTHILTTVGIFLVVYLALSAIIQIRVFGPLKSERELDEFFEPRIDNFSVSPFNSSIMYVAKGRDMKFVAKTSSLLSRWYIHDVGTIPRWSKWNKRLDEKRSEQLEVQQHDL
jgi:hypothetical protein